MVDALQLGHKLQIGQRVGGSCAKLKICSVMQQLEQESQQQHNQKLVLPPVGLIVIQ